jgi:hypothetical protein
MKNNSVVLYLIVFALIAITLGLYFIMHRDSEKKKYSIRDVVFKRPHYLTKAGEVLLPMYGIDYDYDRFNTYLANSK